MPLLLSRCHLVAYTGTCFFVPSFSSLMNPLHSFFFTSLLSLTKLFLYLLLSFTHRNNHGFFFFWSKTLAEHYIVTAQWLLLSSFPFFFFFFFCQKKVHRSSHCRKEIFTWNYLEHWCKFNVWQNVMVEASTMVIWCCESIMFLFFLIKIALIWNARITHSS